jgi:bleomycin hydrolase
MNWRKILFTAASTVVAISSSFAQDNLINSLKNNTSDSSKDGFQFTEIVNLANTSIKDQGSSGTCWSYSGNSFLESEMIRMGREPVEIAQIYTAYYTYLEKAKTFARLHGSQAQGEGGQLHDVLTIYRKYGAVPREAYTGLQENQTRNNFSEMSGILHAMNESIVKNKTLSPNWQKAVTGVMDAYIGTPPQVFEYKGKTYTPRTWADQVVGINPDDYVGISSFDAYPYYKPFVLLIPDNWSFESFYNVQINDLTDIIDNALHNGYTVAWASDVSEKSFSWKNGIAYVPTKDFTAMTKAEQDNMFNGPKDQNGKEYYIVKNSWGATNDYQGYMYATKEFVRYKTISILLHKDAVQKGIKDKLKI